MLSTYDISYRKTTDDIYKYNNGFIKIDKKHNYSTINIYDDKKEIVFCEYIFKNLTIDFKSDELHCILNDIVIKFDDNSSSAWTNFKSELTVLINTKNDIKKYPSGNIMCIGDLTEYENNVQKMNGNGTLFYDTPNNNIKYIGEFVNGLIEGSGTFYTLDGFISISANNIVESIPQKIGQLIINYPNYKTTIDIDFINIWFKLNVYNLDKAIIDLVYSDKFVETIAKLLWKDSKSIDEYKFTVMSNDDKFRIIYGKIEEQKRYITAQDKNIQQINDDNIKQFIIMLIACIFSIILNCILLFKMM